MIRLVSIVIVGLIVIPATQSLTIFCELRAAELRSTNDKHYTRGPNRSPPGMFGGKGKKFRTKVIQAPKRGLIVSDPQPLFRAAALDREASAACREGRLRRFGGGIAEFAGRRYPAATSLDMSRNIGVELQEGVYIFVSEGSTGCQVYLFQQ
ncbi:MAG: hypothetical protein CMM58_07685 [Rhodospirillaceae bacterium]|nr:hypothetical protein [Rhodospirillaceae bacterium]